MSDEEQIIHSSMMIDRILEFKLDPVLTPEEKAKLEFALDKHKESLILLSK